MTTEINAPLHSPDFYIGDPYPVYRALREHDPVHWCDEGGFWAILRYDDIRIISARPDLFSSAYGVMIPNPDVPETIMHRGLVHTDPPIHMRLRQLISRGFTPKRVAEIATTASAFTVTLMDQLADRATCEFAEDLASPLPTQVIAELLGVPSDDWPRFRSWSDAVVGLADPDITMTPAEAKTALAGYFAHIIAARRAEPRQDLISTLATAELDGEQLSDNDLQVFCFLLLVAGNETTRNLIAQGTLALLNHPPQWRMLVDQPSGIPRAVEEMLRWCTPVTHMARRALADTTLRGRVIRAGDRVVMMYGSANRDSEVFGPDAEHFDITRERNPHLAFGHGAHHCLGAALARLEAQIFFAALLDRFPDLRLDGPAERMRSTMNPGVKTMPVRLIANRIERDSP